MAKDDVVLGAEMEKLEIESVKIINKNVKDENPFKTYLLPESRKSGTFTRMQTKKIDFCTCNTQKRNSCINICKKKHKNIIKQSVLKILKDHSGHFNRKEDCVCKTETDTCPFCTMFNTDSSLCTVINNCNQLKISIGESKTYTKTQKNSETETLWWKTSSNSRKEKKQSCNSQNQGSSCSQEALNPSCDVTIDELASYFETLVHIPKKMSSMAEMMYI